MHKNFVSLLRCPESGGSLNLTEPIWNGDYIKSGFLQSAGTGRKYPVLNYIPRFVSSDNYAGNFGLEWNIHSQTQHDDFSHFEISSTRFREETKWGNNLQGELILEAGSGAGRFTGIAAETGATIISFDYSNAVEANFKTNGRKENILIIQADIYNMPFEKASFDRVFCFGVIQHTPDPEKAFYNLVNYLKPGGKLATDIYIKDLLHYYCQTKYYVRPFLKNVNPEKLYYLIKSYIDLMWPLVKIIRKIPFKIGQGICFRLLVADYYSMLRGANDKTLKEWAYLDSFDMLSPAFDKPQTLKTFRQWHQNAGLAEINLHKGYNGVEARAVKPLQKI
ncbi:MAG: class I SAM-dependent methyltransferase [Lentisphaerota bacterium]